MIARTNVLGVGVSAVDMRQAVATIGEWIERRAPRYVTVTGVHGVMESQRDEPLREIHNVAGLVVPDGMPLVWLSRLSGKGEVRRVYGPDLMLECCAEGVERGWKHFLYGGAEGVPELLAERLEARFPGIEIVGAYSPPFRPLTDAEDREVVETIDRSGADIVWVGLGTPKQERWMSEHVGRFGASVLVGVGAAFDFHAGLKSQAPAWMQRAGLEWLYRLGSEPRRLWRRYLINNPLFIGSVLLQAAGVRRYELDATPEPVSR